MDFKVFIKNLRNKTFPYLILVSIIAGIVLSISLTNRWINRVEKTLVLKRQELAAFNNLKEEYLKENSGIEIIKKKIFAPELEGSISAIIEEISNRTGIKDKIASLKPLDEKIEKDYIKRGVEVKITGIDLNQLVNLIYKIDNYKNLILIKDLSIKTRFDNPALVDITIQIVLLTKGGRV